MNNNAYFQTIPTTFYRANHCIAKITKVDTNKIYSVGIHEHNHNVAPEMVLCRRDRQTEKDRFNLKFNITHIIIHHTLHCNVKCPFIY